MELVDKVGEKISVEELLKVIVRYSIVYFY